MPPLEVVFLDQARAVLWSAAGFNPSGIRVVYPPIEIGVRWVGKQRIITDAGGNKIAVDATAETGIQVAPDSLMWLGKLAQWPGTNITPTDNALMRVIRSDPTPDVKGREVGRIVYLSKYKDKLPAVVAT